MIIRKRNHYMKEKAEGETTIQESITLPEIIDLLISKDFIFEEDLDKINWRD